jgi:hypothetical protein
MVPAHLRDHKTQLARRCFGYVVHVIESNISADADSIRKLLPKHTGIFVRESRVPYDTYYDLALFVLHDLRLADVHHVFKDMIEPSEMGSVLQDDVVFLSSVYRSDDPSGLAAIALERAWTNDVLGIVPE